MFFPCPPHAFPLLAPIAGKQYLPRIPAPSDNGFPLIFFLPLSLRTSEVKSPGASVVYFDLFGEEKALTVLEILISFFQAGQVDLG